MRLSIAKLRDARHVSELLGMLVILFGVVSLLALLSYSQADSTWFKLQPDDLPTANWIGRVGATLAETYLQLFGVGAFSLPFLLAFAGWYRLKPPAQPIGWGRIVGFSLLALAVVALAELLFRPMLYGGEVFDHPGGYVGWRFASLLRALLNTFGAVLFCVTTIVGVTVLFGRVSLVRSAEIVAALCVRGVAWLGDYWREWREELAADEAGAARASDDDARQTAPRRPSITLGAAGAAAAPSTPAPPAPALVPRGAVEPAEVAAPAPVEPKQASLPLDRLKRGYSLPPLELLKEPENQRREDEQELLERAEQITHKFREFSIEGTVVAIHPGPVVTTFEFKPEAGVKYSKITGMTDDLSLALKAESVRIDRLPGRSTVGIEVPNRRQETIFPRELIGSPKFREYRSKLLLALGKDIHGEVYVAELDRMPHLLIAGATGAGKSVGLNGMIISMLYTSTPADLRFIMIDTKMIELGIYADIPHLLIPVVTDPKHASAALTWAVREMEQRYRKLAAVGVRNIAQFNELIAEEPDRTMEHPKTGEPVPLEHLPYIVIVIDEMADLMMVSSADVEESVMRLAQMARAVGIHLILATQRPSVDVITGTIKANFPSRIAFRVSQRVDSRTIIDQQGAEHLLGRGDMLFLPTGSARVLRLHSGYITEHEINRVCSFLKKMAEPVYDPSVLADSDERGGTVDDGERDEMYVDAVRTVINEGKCSITLIQRRLQLGYARAARIVDMMESQGVVSPGEGSKPREVLVGPEVLETIDAGR
ncbi:MAG TPA: DNA translocase FtsK [Candidatus Polarisedimenticolaceae bacterium]|nr:DNA translocase FtsK [Candidatus Polarisedimenticolaceae bacterium]